MKPIALALSFILFLNPLITLAQQIDVVKVRLEAEIDARANTNSGLWFLAGFLGGIIGVAIAYIYEPSPPAVKLLGKSPEYVAVYIDAYRSAARKMQARWAWTGCLAWAATYSLIVLLTEMETTSYEYGY